MTIKVVVVSCILKHYLIHAKIFDEMMFGPTFDVTVRLGQFYLSIDWRSEKTLKMIDWILSRSVIIKIISDIP